MAEALHIQRQYRTILDVLASERIGYEAQLIELEKGIAEAKIEATKLKVRSINSNGYCFLSSFFLIGFLCSVDRR